MSEERLREWLMAALEGLRDGWRPWGDLTDAQRAALLLDASLAIQQEEVLPQRSPGMRQACLKFAVAAQEAGERLASREPVGAGVALPYRLAELQPGEAVSRLDEITRWAKCELIRADRPLEVLHALLDLKAAGLELQTYVDPRWRLDWE